MADPTLEELANEFHRRNLSEDDHWDDGWIDEHGPRIAAALRDNATMFQTMRSHEAHMEKLAAHISEGNEAQEADLRVQYQYQDELKARIAKLEKVAEAAKGVIQDSCDCDQCCEFRFALAALEES